MNTLKRRSGGSGVSHLVSPQSRLVRLSITSKAAKDGRRAPGQTPHIAEALAELEVALALGALDELLELVGAALLLLRGLLLVHGLRLLLVHGIWLLLVHGLRLLLVRLLKKTQGLAGSEDPPPKPPVIAWPRVCPTAEPTATPAAVVAIWANMPGCLGAAAAGAAMADGGACIGAGA
ncbi:hypothetical protein EYF80_014326 [Liparis tanakae]|uniref:Uncharacterized protein n=1 Tax=Liparis tanakae TaxID=230148 RepID=A0A4Z2IDP3_9TELE|nr:hypothetical protein EYF80_014326 [Liparis tanakae]